MSNENNSSAPLKTTGVSLAQHRANRIYVAGPMTGLPDFNFPAFNTAANELRAEGWHVENPAEHGIVDGAQWSDYMHTDLQQLSTCCAIYLLPGWSKSRGATLEAHVAQALGMAVYYAPNAENQAVAAQAPAAVAVPTDFELRERWRAAGGSFHGPCVETGTMPEEQLIPFLRDLATTPAFPATEDSSVGDLAEVQPWKDHMTAQLVNQLVDVAKQFHGAQQLRERIAEIVCPLAERFKAAVQAEPVMKWQNGVGLLWDVHAHGKPSHRVVSPLNWDAHGVYLALVDGHYAKHIDVKLVSAENNNLNPEIEAAPAPQAQPADALDAAFEAVRKRFCKLPRYSFLLDGKGNVRRVPGFTGNWVEFEAAHTLFDPQSVDAAMAAAQEGGKAAKEA